MSEPESPEPHRERPGTTSARGLLAGLALGVPVIAYGIRGVLVDAADTHPAELARWVVGAAVVHDAVIVPATLLIAWAARRVVPAAAWPPVRAAMLATAVLALVAWPLVRGYGRDATNPSLLPRDYGTGLAVAVGVVWVGAAAWWAVRRQLARRRRRTGARWGTESPG